LRDPVRFLRNLVAVFGDVLTQERGGPGADSGGAALPGEAEDHLADDVALDLAGAAAELGAGGGRSSAALPVPTSAIADR